MLKGSFAIAVLSLVICPATVIAQRDVQNQDGQTTAASRPSRGSRSSFQQAQLKRLQEQLGATEDEWKILEPRLQKVQDLENSMPRANGFNSGRPRRGGTPGNPSAAVPSEGTPSPAQQAARELQDSLGSKDTKPDEIKSKLVALREARSKAQADLSKAQDQLREVLTARQEAELVVSGILN